MNLLLLSLFFLVSTQAEDIIPRDFTNKVLKLNNIARDYDGGTSVIIQPLLLPRVDWGDYSAGVTGDCSKNCQFVDVNLGFLDQILKSGNFDSNQDYAFAFPKEGNAVETFKFKGKSRDGPSQYIQFQSKEGSTADFMISKKGSLIGAISLYNGTLYSITNQQCGQGCHRLARFDKSVNEIGDQFKLPRKSGSDYYAKKERLASVSSKTVAHTSITFYVTDKVLEKYEDIEGTIKFIVKRVNEGYVKNKIPIQLNIHCIKKFPLSEDDPRMIKGECWQKAKQCENKSVLSTIINLGAQKNRWNVLRNSADIAFLLMLGGKGKPTVGESITYVSDDFDGLSVGFSLMDAAITQFTVDHEIAHLYGAEHQKGVANNLVFPDGHGFMIPPFNSNLRTIMAYAEDGHEKRIQYYSSDKYKGLEGDLILGKTGSANNRDVLIARRFYVANVGDESMPCNSDLWNTGAEYKSHHNSRSSYKDNVLDALKCLRNRNLCH